MPGVNPALLAHLSGGPQPAAAPAGATSQAQPPGGGDHADKPEPVALHDACMELAETVKMAVQMAGDLQSSAELAEEIDPQAEKAIGQAVKLLTQASTLLDQADSTLGNARKEHEEQMGGAGDNDGDEGPGYGG